MKEVQQPIGSGFHAATTASEVVHQIDLTGKTAIVTGGYSGIGLETTRVLAGAGAFVIVPALDPERAARALAGMPHIAIEPLNLSDPGSVARFAERVLEQRRPLHVLVNNAGIMAPPLTRDSRGYEMQLSTNHLGHFQLTLLLWPALMEAEGARVVSVSSRAHRYSPLDIADPNFLLRRYDKWIAYGQSKTANSLFAVAADARGRDHGIRAFAVHPGGIITPLSRHLSNEDLAGYGVSLDTPHGFIPKGKSAAEGGIFKTIPQGAATSVWCATSPMLQDHGGVYCEDVEIARITTTTNMNEPGVYRWAVDPEVADALWALSEEMTRTQLKTAH